MIALQIIFVFTFAIVAWGIYYLAFSKKKEATTEKRESDQVKQQPNQAPEKLEEAQLQEEKVKEEDNLLEQQKSAIPSKKDLLKQQKKQEKKQHSEDVRMYWEQKQKKEEEKQKKQQEKERLKEIEEEEKVEIQKQLEEDQRKREEEEAQKWKATFEIVQEGQERLSPEEEERFLQEQNAKFIKYIKLRKVVQLEDLSTEFKFTIKEVSSKIRSLEMNKMLNGVIDERGKYIFLTERELQKIHDYIIRKGLISKQELLQYCNDQIQLNPSKEDIELIKEEETHLLRELEVELEEKEKDQKDAE